MRGLVVALAVFSDPAWGCEPIIKDNPSELRISGALCSAKVEYSAFSVASISEAADLGRGFVMQKLFDGSCGEGEMAYVVQDCETGEVAVFGGERGDYLTLYEGPDGEVLPSFHADVLMEEMKLAVRQKRLSISEILDKAASMELPVVAKAETDSLVTINGRRFPIGCGCRTFYPNGVTPGD